MGWLSLPAIWVDMPAGASPEPVEMLAGDASDEEIVNPEIAALEEEAETSEIQVHLPALPDQPSYTAFAPLAFVADGEFRVGAPITFSIPDADPGQRYQLDLGNGVVKTLVSSLTYTYPKEGVFLAVLVSQQGDVMRSSTKVLEIISADAIDNGSAGVDAAMLTPAAHVSGPNAGTVEMRTVDRSDTAAAKEALAIASEPKPMASRSDDSTPVAVPNLPPRPLKPLDFAEVAPSFPGGKAEMTRFLNKQIQYPKLALENEIGGKVYAQFVVEANGTISQIKVVRGIGYGCDEEALRILRLMPNWTPGQQGGQAVPVIYTLPINFDFSRY